MNQKVKPEWIVWIKEWTPLIPGASNNRWADKYSCSNLAIAMTIIPESGPWNNIILCMTQFGNGIRCLTVIFNWTYNYSHFPPTTRTYPNSIIRIFIVQNPLWSMAPPHFLFVAIATAYPTEKCSAITISWLSEAWFLAALLTSKHEWATWPCQPKSWSQGLACSSPRFFSTRLPYDSIMYFK